MSWAVSSLTIGPSSLELNQIVLNQRSEAKSISGAISYFATRKAGYVLAAKVCEYALFNPKGGLSTVVAIGVPLATLGISRTLTILGNCATVASSALETTAQAVSTIVSSIPYLP